MRQTGCITKNHGGKLIMAKPESRAVIGARSVRVSDGTDWVKDKYSGGKLLARGAARRGEAFKGKVRG